VCGAIPDPSWTAAPPTANQLVKEQLVTYRTRHVGGPHPGWGQTPGWSPLVDDGPASLQAARSVGRWLWPTLAVAGFGAVASFVLRYDDPAPGLSQRGLGTIALAALVVVLLTIRRSAGPGPLARALAEYAVVALLAVLVATTGVDVDQTPAGDKQASAVPDHRPALVKVIDGARDWLGAWRQWADQESDRRSQAAPTTLDPSHLPTLLPAVPLTWRTL
jgi:hypothetical protein